VKPRRRLLAALACALAGLLAGPLAGCALAPPRGAPPVAKLGLVAPFEGRYRELGYDVIWAVRLAVREYNLTRRPEQPLVELVAYDDGGDPERAGEQARKLGVDPAVVAVLGHWRPATTAAAADLYADLALPFMTAETQPRPESFSLAPDAARLSALLTAELVGRGAERIAILGPDTPLARALSDTLGLAGGEVVLRFEPAGRDWVGRVRAADPEAVFFSGDALAAAEAVLALSGGRVRALLAGGPSLAEPDFARVAGAQGDGAIVVTGRPLPVDLARLGDFETRYRSVAFGGAPPGRHAALAYESTWLLLDALARAALRDGQATRAGVARALLSARREGLFGPLYFNAARRWPGAPAVLYVLRGGRLERP
jgi:ABC-type branched-subunit amino acid transport system substrate-binding protein